MFSLIGRKGRIFVDALRNCWPPRNTVYYIVEAANWSIKHDGYSITKNLTLLRSTITTTRHGIKNSIVHFGSINTFFGNNKIKLPHKSNRIVTTWFHVFAGDKRVELIPEAIRYVDLWHTSASLTSNELINLGIPRNKVVKIPLGVNLDVFRSSTSEQKYALRSKLGIPKSSIVIGSFQKDGSGWGEGLRPKFIKGPDIFCDVIEHLAKKYRIFVVLTGPARGYVKQRLTKAGIPYLHHLLTSPDEVAEYYKTLDLYIVASRREGGPKAILESLASGVPLVSTKVGMAPDIIQHGENGFLCEIDDVQDIADKAVIVIENEVCREQIIEKGLATVAGYDWRNIAGQYMQMLYRPLL